MDKKASKTSVSKPNKRIIAGGAAILIILLIILLVAQLAAPKRSVAAYCQTYKDEKARLAALPGDTWPAGIFDDELSDAGEIAKSISKLEKVAPEEIRSDVATLQSIYQKIHDDPSQAISASLGGVSAEQNVKDWTKAHCAE